MTKAFLDTNVLLYLLSGDAAKAARAEAILLEGGVISVQVLNEFAHVARRKFRAPWEAVWTSLEAIQANVSIEPLTLDTHYQGLKLAERYQLSVFDGLLLASANLAGCDRFYSEDMQDGMVVGGLRIENPFRISQPG